MVRKRHALAIGMRVCGEGAAAAVGKFGPTEGVSKKRDTPIVSLLEQGRDPSLLQTRDNGGRRREMSKVEVGKTTDGPVTSHLEQGRGSLPCSKCEATTAAT